MAKIQLDTPQTNMTGRKPLNVRFYVGKEYFRALNIDDPSDKRRKPVQLVHMYPLLSDYAGRMLPDSVNPRSHDKDCLSSPVARAIQQTILEQPEDFYLANRGTTILADSIHFDAKSGMVELTLTDAENQGAADGATTDAVVNRVQKLLTNGKTLSEVTADELPEQLKTARIHLEIFVGLEDRERIAKLVEGRNTSRQVRAWSMADFQGYFDWLKDIVEKENSPFKGRIGYEENAPQPITILDALALLTLFHPEFDIKDGGESKAPTIAYSGKGRIAERLRDPETIPGYKGLAPIVEDIFKLHDYIYSRFPEAYDKAFAKTNKHTKLGKRKSIETLTKPAKLPLTGEETYYMIPGGFIFPLLASFRALLGYHRADDSAYWRTSPFGFFDRHGHELIARLMDQADDNGGNPNTMGKKKNVYTSLHDAAKMLYAEERNG